MLVDQATDASLSSDAVLLKIDRFGQRFQRCRAVQETVRPVLVVVGLVLAQDLQQMGEPGLNRGDPVIRILFKARFSRSPIKARPPDVTGPRSRCPSVHDGRNDPVVTLEDQVVEVS
jgi:hypothetical protein